ncbi:hypothetical protein FHT00_002415 [Sphingomonas insulae]|uniref:Uncharacterized protein n=1 Tax=Sphingomonas insulae TaxID=424800 RepID=A0ABN1HKR8_9SPHN|nr:hypothetical protein [Sphingomonas insulae]NIJ30452.1 hypothetical protein [Sphingomonas insulae]
MRFWPCLMLLALAQPALAGREEGPYYGPMKGWQGVGYKDHVEKDGTWRVEAARRGPYDAIDLALYRAAERARDAGYRYVFLLGGTGRRNLWMNSATLYARPSHEAVAPVGCRSRKATTCYTADVAEVLRILGGPDGTQPGVAIVDHRDEYGRAVYLSGYGTGAVATLVPGGGGGSRMMTIVDKGVTITGAAPAAARAAIPAAPMPPVPVVIAPARPVQVVAVPVMPAGRVMPRGAVPLTPDERFQRALKASQPVRGGDPQQGWTISD